VSDADDGFDLRRYSWRRFGRSSKPVTFAHHRRARSARNPRDTTYFGGTDDRRSSDASIDAPRSRIVARLESEVPDIRSRFAIAIPDDDP
jgi:hypothetical protein